MNISFGSVKHTDILLFTKHLAVALKSGITLYEGIDMLYDQAAGKMKHILKEMLAVLESGKPFYQALERYPQYFSSIYVSLIKTGELAGTLEENLNHLSEELRKAHELRQKVKSAMMYPTLIFVAVLGLAFSVAIFVLPKILPLFKTLNVELPVTTRALMFIGEAFQKNGLMISGVTVAGIFFLVWFLRREFIKPILHRFYLMLPIVKNIIININLERFTRTLGTLLTSNIPVDRSLLITAEATENRMYRKAIMSFILEVENGNPLASALEHYPELFPKITSRMVSMGEKTGNLDHTLEYLSEFYAGEVDTFMKNLSTILEPFLLIVIGVIVGTVAISILGPIYKITGNLRK